jgi:glycosidase
MIPGVSRPEAMGTTAGAQHQRRTALHPVSPPPPPHAISKPLTCVSAGSGSFEGIVDRLDYIVGMGFDAIWISPVVDNVACGYHGYWAQNQFGIEEHFGGAAGLRSLMSACKARNIAVMLDVVANHMGPPSSVSDFHEFTPFNSTDHYHGALGHHCSNTNTNQHQREVCWLANLGDLRQEDPWVSQTLVRWASELQARYHFDGVRIDTVPYVNQSFWHLFQENGLGGASTYSVGEVLVQDLWEHYEASYQVAVGHEGYSGPLLGGVLNYKLFDAVRGALMYGGGLENIQQVYENNAATFADVGALGNFVENHDQTRWLLNNPDPRSYKNGLVAAFFLPGVPIAYYGTEQLMAGGQSDNDKRQPLWRHGGYNTSARLYQWTKLMVAARKQMLASCTNATIDAVRRMHSEDMFLAFQRCGATVVVAATTAPRSKQPVKGQTTVVVQTDLGANVRVCDALMARHWMRSLSVAGADPACAHALSQLCGSAERSGQVECGVCLGEHEAQLHAANCSDKQAKSFCNAAHPDPSPAPPPSPTPGCNAAAHRIDCTISGT